jgi:membrane dipeptidase
VLPLYIPKSVSPAGPRLEDLEHSYAAVFGALVRTPPYRLPGCASSERKVQTWLAFEGSAPLAGPDASVARWVARGARLFGLVHSYDNRLAGSSGSQSNLGLTKEGRMLVERVHARGGVIDVSHASDRATDEIIALGRRDGRPVVATHSNARSLAPHPRNLTDAQLSAIAATGGVVGINFHQPFLARSGRTARLSDVVKHVLHLRRVAGIDALALGSDFEGDIRPVPELSDASRFQELARALGESGLSEAEIHKIFYKNALRVLCPAP